MPAAMRRFLKSNRVRTVLLVVLALVVLLTGVPVLVGGSGAGHCADCGPMPTACPVPCATLPAALGVMAAMLLGVVVGWPHRRWGPGFAWLIDPPPRLV